MKKSAIFSVLAMALSLTLTPQAAFGNTDESCIKKLQYVESRMQIISYNFAQVENIVHSQEFLDNWMKENNFKTENEATHLLQSKFLSPAKLLLQENLDYMKNQYALDCAGAPYYETGLKYYGEIFSEARKGEFNLWVKFDTVLQKTTLTLERYKPKDTSQDQLSEMQYGNLISQKIKEYSGKLYDRVDEKYPNCKYPPRAPIPYGPTKSNYTSEDVRNLEALLDSWLTNELSNLDQARCPSSIEKSTEEFSKDDIFKKETELLKKYKDDLDRQIASKIGMGCCGYRYLVNPPPLLQGNFPKSKEHFLDFELKLQTWYNYEIANLSANNLENPSDFSIDAFVSLTQQYTVSLMRLVQERLGDVQWNLSSPMPSYKDISVFSKQTFDLYQQNLRNWLATFPVSIQSVTQDVGTKSENPVVVKKQSTIQTGKDKPAVSKSPVKSLIKEKTIFCFKAKNSLKIVGKNPKCPAGYRVKK
jgi:hypothetical protein